MKATQSTAILAMGTVTLLAGYREAQAITLPDNSSCSISSSSSACLKITNTTTSSTGAAISAVATNNFALRASSTKGAAINASSFSKAGVEATSTSSYAITGSTNAGRPFAGVYGYNNGAGFGVMGRNDFSDPSCVDEPGTGCAAAIFGDANHNTTSTWAGLFNGDVNLIADFELYINGIPQAVSDARLKTDVNDVPYGLEHVLQLRPVTYKFKEAHRDRTYLGLFAQDVQKIIPELVRSRGQSDVLAVNYNGLIPVLVKAVQERAEGIRQREVRIATMEQRRKRMAASLFTDPLSAVAAFGSLSFGMMGLAAGRRRKVRAQG